MKKLLMFLVLLTVSVGTWAADVNWSNGQLQVTGSNKTRGSGDYQYLTVSSPGALAAWIDATKPELNGVGSDGKGHLRIDGNLNADDLAALNSANISVLGAFKSLDLQEATIPDLSSLSSMNLGNLEHLLLPCGYEGDATAFKDIKTSTNNLKLKLVVSTDANTDPQAIAIYSFKKNNVQAALLSPSGILMHKTNIDNQYTHVYSAPLSTVKTVRMAGIYGEQDLSKQYNNDALFGNTPAYWDFTGADFAPCTLASFTFANGNKYYDVDDPFHEESTGLEELTNYKTNAFCYFRVYAREVLDITLPTEIDVLPPGCLFDLATKNKANYKTAHNLNDEQFASQFSYVDQNGQIQVPEGGPIETLTIPNNYRILDYECAFRPNIRHLVVGNGVKEARGGAFGNSTMLEDLDFAAGLSNCYIGDFAFGESHSMKHIALSEGIVSVGGNAFSNSQQLESIRLPQSLIYIGNNAFDNCLALNSITIPENVDKIGKDAFKLCPFTDIFLTTTDPNKIPAIFTGGNSFDNWGAGASFNHGHYDGWEGLKGVHQGSTPDGLSWDAAVEWYFVNCNGLPVLHYPTQLAGKVRSDISRDYDAHSSDIPSLGLPTAEDMHDREIAGGANVGTSGQGIYTRDGWAQFMLMKEYTTDPGGDVYKKKYEDVWYTMCFPFDLSDEQLAAAFNETFNIVDFSGVEVTEKTETNPLTLTLHFNTVAQTTYKDEKGAIYLRKMDDDGKPVREKHGKFSYNVYYKANADGTPDTSEEYHHAHVSAELSTNKTKTFAPGTEPLDLTGKGANKSKVVTIDGILATAGHPYMIHPAIGTSKGNPRRCDFSGIEWPGVTTWPTLFEQQKRVVDLGVQRGSFTGNDINDHSKWTPDADNYMQPRYPLYNGQTYTFIGNPTLLRTDVANYPADLQEPTVENGGLQVLPSISDYTSLYPKGPAMSAERKAVVRQYGEKMTEADMPTEVQNPANAPKYAEVKDLLMAERVSWEENGQTYSFKYYEDLASYDVSEFFTHWSNWAFQNQSIGHNYKTVSNDGLVLFKAFFNDIFNGNNESSTSPEGKFAELKALAVTLVEEMEPYNQYQEELAAYYANVAAWNNYEQAHAQEESEYQTALSAYTTAVNQWRDAYNTAESANESAIAAWQADIVPYQIYIPKNAYFLGRKGTDYPKYYREIAENPAEGSASTRQGGAWNQFTAIIIPNEAAINGIESKLGPGVANNTKGLNMVFDEGFMGEFNPTEIKDIVAEAEEKGQKVEYMNIVYSINGEVVGRGSHSLSNLPQGMYIINGKKYLVK